MLTFFTNSSFRHVTTGNREGFERWAKLNNLKEAARTFNYLSENNLLNYEDFQSEITDITISSDGKVKIEFILNPSVSGEVKVTEVQLYSTSGELWWSKAENITKKSKKEGIYYRVTINILEE